MTCVSALELLLDAEPSEFGASQPTPLGEHLRRCTRCRRVAAQLMQDTQRLAVALESAVPVRRPARRVMQVMVPAFALAAIIIAVMLRASPEASDLTQVVDEPAMPVVAPPVVARSESPDASTSRPRAAHNVRREPRAFAPAVPLAPVRLEPSGVRGAHLAMETSGVTVTPPAGTRATVMHTSNPKLVVVWLY